jgi:hypothetical protein
LPPKTEKKDKKKGKMKKIPFFGKFFCSKNHGKSIDKKSLLFFSALFTIFYHFSKFDHFGGG